MPGLMNFLRTLAGAFSTSLTTTAWENYARHNKAELSAVAHTSEGINAIQAQGGPYEIARGVVDRIVEGQSLMLATNRLLLILACVLFAAAFTIWLAPKQTHFADISRAH